MREALGFALKNAMATVGTGAMLLAGYVSFQAIRDDFGQWELKTNPVLRDVAICEGTVDKTTGDCSGHLRTYGAFEQTAMRCDGPDAIVEGTMAKARDDVAYRAGHQALFFGKPNGRSRRAFWQALDQPRNAPSNRPAGVQDWGPWVLKGGCDTSYRTWFSTVEHEPWHGLWPLKTRLGPFPLPVPSGPP